MKQENRYDVALDRNAANYVPLSPLTFLERSARTYPNRSSIVYGQRHFTWAQTYERCRRLAHALSMLGIRQGETVATMLPNVPAMMEAHFGVPMAGGVLNTLNTRLDAEAIAFMLRHGGARVLLTDREFSPVVKQALEMVDASRLYVVDVDDTAVTGGDALGQVEYEAFIAAGDPDFKWGPPSDEWNAISLNYTSGTTGDPKGVVYHHRGAFLNAVSNILSWGMPPHATYLWTLPMFHCNGWCFPWTLAANAGTSICLRRVDAGVIFDLIETHHVTHMSGAPIVFSTLINSAHGQRLPHRVEALIAGAAPPTAVIEGAERMGISITHVYGLTEVYGPAAVCAKQPEWEDLTVEERAERNGRQGVRYHMQEAVEVLHPETLLPVPHDGETIGEICFRGNLVMKGYLQNATATAKAFAGGWFHTGDLAVVQPDGYIKIKDRSKDIIISGGENISSVEVEDVLYRHPSVLAAAVVAQPDPKWGEVPCAFIELKQGASAAESDIVDHCRRQLARFKVPKKVIFGTLPKTSTGKIQKFLLREQVKSTSAIE